MVSLEQRRETRRKALLPAKSTLARSSPAVTHRVAPTVPAAVASRTTLEAGELSWAYGLTTVPERRGELLPRTLASLRAAGFDSPRLFVDGQQDPRSYEAEFGLPVTIRWPIIRAYGNWALALVELYIRSPDADRYAIFQDDFVTYRNLKVYLERTACPKNGYCNLYTFPQEQRRVSGIGWFESRQFGLGALALVFSRDAVITLLSQSHLAKRLQDKDRRDKFIDGAVVWAMNPAGYREFVHNPSLVQHTGRKSSLGNGLQALASSFRGEQFDALELLNEVTEQRRPAHPQPEPSAPAL